MVSLINKQLLLTAYAYLFIMEQQKAQQGGEALQLQVETKGKAKGDAAKERIMEYDVDEGNFYDWNCDKCDKVIPDGGQGYTTADPENICEEAKHIKDYCCEDCWSRSESRSQTVTMVTYRDDAHVARKEIRGMLEKSERRDVKLNAVVETLAGSYTYFSPDGRLRLQEIIEEEQLEQILAASSYTKKQRDVIRTEFGNCKAPKERQQFIAEALAKAELTNLTAQLAKLKTGQNDKKRGELQKQIANLEKKIEAVALKKGLREAFATYVDCDLTRRIIELDQVRRVLVVAAENPENKEAAKKVKREDDKVQAFADYIKRDGVHKAVVKLLDRLPRQAEVGDGLRKASDFKTWYNTGFDSAGNNASITKGIVDDFIAFQQHLTALEDEEVREALAKRSYNFIADKGEWFGLQNWVDQPKVVEILDKEALRLAFNLLEDDAKKACLEDLAEVEVRLVLQNVPNNNGWAAAMETRLKERMLGNAHKESEPHVRIIETALDLVEQRVKFPFSGNEKDEWIAADIQGKGAILARLGQQQQAKKSPKNGQQQQAAEQGGGASFGVNGVNVRGFADEYKKSGNLMQGRH